jgi:hypothetical protein
MRHFQVTNRFEAFFLLSIYFKIGLREQYTVSFEYRSIEVRAVGMCGGLRKIGEKESE